MRTWAGYACVLLAVVCSQACEADEGGRAPDVFDSGGPPLDAALGTDANDNRPPMPDAQAPADAAVVSSRCRVSGDGVTPVAERAFDPRGPIALAAHTRGALLGWSQYRAGKPRVFARWFGVEAEAVEAPSEGDTSQVNVHASATRDGFVTTWIEDDGALHARRTTDEGVPRDDTLVASEPIHRDATSAEGADGALLVAYVDRGTNRGSTRLLGADLKPTSAARDAFGTSVGRPALAALGSGYLLAFVESTTRRVSLQRLDAVGAPVGASTRIDSDGDARGYLDLATTETGGALAWDVLVGGSRAEIRLRAIGMDGLPTNIEQNLTPFPDSGLHPALVAARGGYLVAYRGLRGGTSTLQLLLVDGLGKRISADHGAVAITDLQQQDLPLAMRMTRDGLNVLVGFLDQTPNTTDYALQRAWIGCD